MKAKKFDLNIERILEDWEVFHAIREIIANAMDEQILTKTQDIQIFKDEKGCWHIRDFGRGLKYDHLTQKEDEEKLKHPHVIGKFGIGLKDALATFDRKGVNVFIKSSYGDITLEKSEKHDFNDIITLHACIHPPSESDFKGTEFILSNCSEKDVNKAKELFLRFSNEQLIEKTNYGAVLKKAENTNSRIYVNGVKVAEEEKFLFSYNITSLNKSIRSALNRERTNVGRSAYTDRVKSILLSCKTKTIAKTLVDDLKGYEDGTIHDELGWLDVSVYACKLLNSLEKVVFFSPREIESTGDMVAKAKDDGYEITIIPENIRDKIRGMKDISGNPIRDLNQFGKEWNEGFKFKFISEDEMTQQERAVFNETERILKLIGERPKNVKEILISETMRLDAKSYSETTGLFDASMKRIIIKRKQLENLQTYAGTLLHELAHARSGASDFSREFEHELSCLLGLIANKYLGNN